MAEWLKASDCKSDHYVYVGSNPTLSTIYFIAAQYIAAKERRMLCSGKTSAFQADDASSILAIRSKIMAWSLYQARNCRKACNRS